ncbi:hypothetical protein OHA25_09945 [Nonomuraea sp. NBC_00507]|uniref:hypothetical protein n=1 Tax=Nonomuraea sp. NBC_00507 TaxID=2976002 RepID=UPI002E1799E1
MARTLRLAVAQSTVPEDPTDPRTLRASGAEVRSLMREAAAAGARLVLFPEGAITYPSKADLAHQKPVAADQSGQGPSGDDTADDAITFEARVCLDTPREADYYRHGGIMRYVLRNLLR